ncbi:Hypothetical predicted protein [Cloeon dipterum]|uniref:C2H2-type domain-containing protein n=1 Tax=Cloeon dipterum TaxID=197152 RepID=A0A8S1CW57_9INSE|nr:Hypothetical predicted protein [Cloeon dipterum]CAB3387536.1 Hypothetical predicted protein [Cloeon dipterum]
MPNFRAAPADERVACDYCPKSFCSLSTLRHHLKQFHRHAVANKLTCGQCKKAFAAKALLDDHIRKHSDLRSFVCEVCGKSFFTFYDLKKHRVRVHVNTEKIHTCHICGLGFSMKATLDNHVQRHDQAERRFFCDLCGYGAYKKTDLAMHLASTHLKSKQHSCPHCDKRFGWKSTLQKHVKNLHKEAQQSKQCPLCSKVLKHWCFAEHLQSHTQNFECDICKANFGRKLLLRRHKLKVHNVLMHKCEFCERRFARRTELNVHRYKDHIS